MNKAISDVIICILNTDIQCHPQIRSWITNAFTTERIFLSDLIKSYNRNLEKILGG